MIEEQKEEWRAGSVINPRVGIKDHPLLSHQLWYVEIFRGYEDDKVKLLVY